MIQIRYPKQSKSINGYECEIGEWVVYWKYSTQMCIARYTMEYVFIALDKTNEEIEWIGNFLENIPSGRNMCP